MKALIKILLPILFLTFVNSEIFAQKKVTDIQKAKATKVVKKKRTPKEVTPPPPLPSEPKIADESPVPFFIGGGKAAEWSIELLQGMDASLMAKITTNDDAKTYSPQLYKQVKSVSADNFQNVYGSKPNPIGKSEYEVQFINEECVDNAGKKHSNRVILKINDKIYQGCGDFAATMPTELTGKYTLVAINGKKISQDNNVEIDVFRHSIFAQLGCNSISGDFNITQTDVNVGVLRSTKMACPDMSLETEFNKTISLAKKYKNNDYGLILLDEKGAKIIELKRK